MAQNIGYTSPAPIWSWEEAEGADQSQCGCPRTATVPGIADAEQRSRHTDGTPLSEAVSAAGTNRIHERTLEVHQVKHHMKAATLLLLLPFAQFGLAQEEIVEEIVVTGIRQSLEAAADLKRNDARVIDAIVAEDIGKLPDNNVAEALQRVTGVSINRDFGVGSEVSIRGLPQNRVELNGRSMMGDGRNGINFQDFPANFLSSAAVIKSPTPEMIEGALGGTISLNTVRPIDLKAPRMALGVETEYADKADNWAPIANGHFGNKWELAGGGTFGVLGMVSYQDRRLRRDAYETSLFVFDNVDVNLDGVVDINDAAQNTPSGQYVVPVEPKIEPWTEDRERTALNLMLQWAPESGKGNVYVDLNRTERDGGQEAYSILSVVGRPVATAATYEDGNGALNNYRLEGNHFAIPKTWSQFRVTESFSHAIGGEWDFTDNLTVSGEFAFTDSDTSNPKSEFNWRAIDPALEAANPSASNERWTEVTIDNSPNKAPGVVYDDGPIYTQTNFYAFREFRHITDDIDNHENAFRLDAEYTQPFGWEWATAFKAGVRTTSREYERNRAEVRVKDIHKDMRDADGNPTIIWMDDVIRDYPGTIVTPDVHSDLFEHVGIKGTNHLAPFIGYDAKRLRNTARTFAMVQELLAGSNYNTPGNSDGYISPTGGLGDSLRELKSSYAQIEEDTTALYLQANLDFDRVRMIVGGRYVRTEVTSDAYDQSGTSIVSDTTTYGEFLPSFNAVVDLTEDTLMRFSAGRVMRRPDFGELSPTFQYNSDRILATRGNPELEPYRATQFDIAFERYFGAGNLLSATFFYKDVASFLKTTTFCAHQPEALATQNHTIYDNICIRPTATGDSNNYVYATSREEFDGFLAAGRNGILTTTVTNGSSGTVEGFELGWTQSFDFLPGFWSGLGVNANYTYSDSEDPDGVPLEDISKNTYNLQVFWEHAGVGIRLAYTHRDRFLDNNYAKRVERVGALVANRDPAIGDPTEGNDYRDDLSQLDLAFNWDVNNRYSVFAHVYNVTAEPTINQSVTGTPWQIRETDRRYTVGFRARFQ